MRTDFVETNSNVLSRSFLERSSIYLMLNSNQNTKTMTLLESLIYGDLVAMDVLDFSKTENKALFCAQLVELDALEKTDAIFTDQLENQIQDC